MPTKRNTNKQNLDTVQEDWLLKTRNHLETPFEKTQKNQNVAEY